MVKSDSVLEQDWVCCIRYRGYTSILAVSCVIIKRKKLMKYVEAAKTRLTKIYFDALKVCFYTSGLNAYLQA